MKRFICFFCFPLSFFFAKIFSMFYYFWRTFIVFFYKFKLNKVFITFFIFESDSIDFFITINSWNCWDDLASRNFSFLLLNDLYVSLNICSSNISRRIMHPLINSAWFIKRYFYLNYTCIIIEEKNSILVFLLFFFEKHIKYRSLR